MAGHRRTRRSPAPSRSTVGRVLGRDERRRPRRDAAADDRGGRRPPRLRASDDRAADHDDRRTRAVTFTVRPGVNQVAVARRRARRRAGARQTSPATWSPQGVVDELGSFLGASSCPASTASARRASRCCASEPFTVMSPDDVPPQSLYTDQSLLRRRLRLHHHPRRHDAVSVNVVLPGPVRRGPYPTVVEYSGYHPSDPDSTTFGQLFNALGFAYVGVNMRGTGCSGGSFQFFETAQNLDGYDVIETVAAQPWVAGPRGRHGRHLLSRASASCSSPRPSRRASPRSRRCRCSTTPTAPRCTPAASSTPGSPSRWLTERQTGVGARRAGVDQDPRRRRRRRVRRQPAAAPAEPRLPRRGRGQPFYDPAHVRRPARPGHVRRPDRRARVPRRGVAGRADRRPLPDDARPTSPAPRTCTPTLLNGLHTESISPTVFPRLLEFLDLYVAQRTPSLDAARLVAPILSAGIYGTDQVSLPPDRFAGMTYEDALAAFEVGSPDPGRVRAGRGRRATGRGPDGPVLGGVQRLARAGGRGDDMAPERRRKSRRWRARRDRLPAGRRLPDRLDLHRRPDCVAGDDLLGQR